MGEYIEHTQIGGIIKKERGLGKKIALCSGCFDPFNAGHNIFLNAVKGECLKVYVSEKTKEYEMVLKELSSSFYSLSGMEEIISTKEGDLEKRIEDFKTQLNSFSNKEWSGELSSKLTEIGEEFKKAKQCQISLFINVVNDHGVRYVYARHKKTDDKNKKRPQTDAMTRVKNVVRSTPEDSHVFIYPNYSKKIGPTALCAERFKPEIYIRTRSWDENEKNEIEEYIKYKPTFVVVEIFDPSNPLHNEHFVRAYESIDRTKALINSYVLNIKQIEKNILKEDAGNLIKLTRRYNAYVNSLKKEEQIGSLDYIKGFLNDPKNKGLEERQFLEEAYYSFLAFLENRDKGLTSHRETIKKLIELKGNYAQQLKGKS